MKKLASQFKALSDETRLKILSLLTKQELCVCEIIDDLNMTQSAVSHHLKILKNAELVEDRREGKWIFYSLHDHNLSKLKDDFSKLVIRTEAEKECSKACERNVAVICESIQAKEKAIK